MKNVTVLMATLSAATLLIALPASAESQYPAKTIEMVVPFPPGGGADTTGRIIASALSDKLGQQVVVINKPGAAGTLGTTYVARAKSDGYTVLLGQVNSNAITPAVYNSLSYDMSKDFEPVGYIGYSPTVLVAKPDIHVSSVKELVALAKKEPATLFYASDGKGAAANLAGELFKQITGTDITHVPYKGSSPAVVDIMAGNVDIGFFTLPATLPNIKTGKLKALAIVRPSRQAELPDVPTFSEAGYPKFQVQNWYGLLAPAGTPDEAIGKLNTALQQTLAEKDVVDKLARLGIEAGEAGTPPTFATFIKNEIDKYSQVVEASHMKLD